MLAELHSERNERKFNVYVLKCANNQIISTIPTLKSEPIYFFPEELISLSIPTNNHIYFFETHLSHMKKLNGVPVYVFSIVMQGEKKNIRKDLRLHTDLPAACTGLHDNDVAVATILDVSKHGLKIETCASLLRKTFHIVFDNGIKKESRRVKIAWTKKTGSGYQYGLQTVF